MHEDKRVDLTDREMREFLLRHKYLSAIQRVARGITHSYNNIFTGLGGQMAMLQQDAALAGDLGTGRRDLIDGLLQRGIEQTAILYGFARDCDTECRRHSPLRLASKALELLQSISRVHRFDLVSGIRQEKIQCVGRDIVLMLFYLGENCVDATPGGGEVVLEIERETGNAEHGLPGLVYRFRDTGPGFPDDMSITPDIPFQTRNKDDAFKGLGLYCANVLCRRHQGTIMLERDRDRRSVVAVSFPTAEEEQPAVPPMMDKRRGYRKESLLAKQCFLIVEDDEAMRMLLLNRLQRQGHMVFCVESCREALVEYRHLNEIITTVLMDVGLKDGSGYECCKSMLAINPDARIIFMSGQEESFPEGSGDKAVFLQKPFTMVQLEKAVRDVQI